MTDKITKIAMAMPFQFRWLGTAATNSCNENSHMSKKDKANLDDDKHGQKKQLGRYSLFFCHPGLEKILERRVVMENLLSIIRIWN